MVKGCFKEEIDVGHFIFFPPSEVGESYCIIANFTSLNQQSFPFSLSSVVFYFWPPHLEAISLFSSNSQVFKKTNTSATVMNIRVKLFTENLKEVISKIIIIAGLWHWTPKKTVLIS